MKVESSKRSVVETLRKMEDDMWQYENPSDPGYFSKDYLSDQKMSLSHELIFKD